MKIAWFSPLPPQRTGIADYSVELLPALLRRSQVDLWVDQTVDAPPGCKVLNYVERPELLSDLNKYDAVIYQMGNSPAHRNIFPVLLEYPGIVVLHDFVLHHFLAGYYLEARRAPALYVREMAYNYGSAGEDLAKSALRSKTPIWEQDPIGYPLNKRVLDHARALIVHSEFALRLARKTHSYLPIRKISLPVRIEEVSADAAELKRRYAIPADTIVIGSFGSANPAKMSGAVARAIAAARQGNLLYLIVGEMGENIRAQMRTDHGEMVRITGYVDDKTFSDYCNLIDIGVDLRYQTMGESSAGVCRMLAAAKPCVVSNIGWFAEIPDGCAVKLDAADEPALAACLSELIADEPRRRGIGERARSYISEHHAPEQAAGEYVDFIDEVRGLERSRGVRRAILNETGRALAELGVGDGDDRLIGELAQDLADLLGPQR